MDKHEMMMRTCDPMNSECEFTTADGCEAETGDCSCTVWDLIEQLAAMKATNAEDERIIHRYVDVQHELQEQLAAAQREAESNDRHAQEMVSIYQETLAKLDVAETARKRNLEQLAAANARIKDLEAQLHPTCTCERCTGIPDPYKEGEQ